MHHLHLGSNPLKQALNVYKEFAAITQTNIVHKTDHHLDFVFLCSHPIKNPAVDFHRLGTHGLCRKIVFNVTAGCLRKRFTLRRAE